MVLTAFLLNTKEYGKKNVGRFGDCVLANGTEMDFFHLPRRGRRTVGPSTMVPAVAQPNQKCPTEHEPIRMHRFNNNI